MEQIMNYIKPELIVVAVVLYFVGMGLKQSQTVKDKYIPAILGAGGIFLATIYVIATCPLGTMQEIAMAVFTAIVQGILVAGLSTYVNQIVKQGKKSRSRGREIALFFERRSIMAKICLDAGHGGCR